MRLQTSCTCSSTLGFARHERGGDHHRRKAIFPAPRAALARHRKVPQIYCGFDQEPTCLRGHRHHCAHHGPVIRGSTPRRAVSIAASADDRQLASVKRSLLGTDWEGFDILTLLVYGGQISLIIGFSASIVAMVLGTLVGVVGGFYGGITDLILARMTDFFLVIPWLPFVLVLVIILTPSLATIILAIAIVSWPSTARVIRSQVLTVKERQ